MAHKANWSTIEDGERTDFVKLIAGKKTKLHILDESPVEFRNHRNKANPKSRPEKCKGPSCPYCARPEEYDSKPRWVIAVFNMDERRMQVLENGKKVFKGIRDAWEAYDSDFTRFDISITRTGSGLDTEYSVVPIPSMFKPDMIKGLEKFDVAKIYKADAEDDAAEVVETRESGEAAPDF